MTAQDVVRELRKAYGEKRYAVSKGGDAVACHNGERWCAIFSLTILPEAPWAPCRDMLANGVPVWPQDTWTEVPLDTKGGSND